MAEDYFDQAPSVGDLFTGTAPLGVIVHSLECDAVPGLARDLAAGYIKNEGVSPHRMTDPIETVGVCHINRVGFHVRNPGNMFLIGKEVTGRATWGADGWLTPNALNALRQDAKDMADIWREKGWNPDHMRWGSGAELQAARDAYNAGRTVEPRMWTHNDVSQFLGGTDHWDPGPNFPYALFYQLCHQYYGDWSGDRVGTPGNTGGSGVGGASPWSVLDWLLSPA